MPESQLRDARWLDARLRRLWDAYFSDAPAGYPITVFFGRRARYRYGSIYSRGRQCFITVNGLFAHPAVPEHVVDATLIHELAHYVHGYGSGLRKLHSSPHRGGVIDRELKQRGCWHIEERAAEWRRTRWPDFYVEQNGHALEHRALREEDGNARWSAFLEAPGMRTLEEVRHRADALARLFGFGSAPFTVEWLPASLHRRGLSYRMRSTQTVRIHGLLADPRVPDEVIDYELLYWLATEACGPHWHQLEQGLKQRRLWARASRGIRWRRKVWAGFLAEHHPLRSRK